MVQRKAVRFISNLRGREGFTSEREALDLELLQDRRMDARVKLSSDTHSLLTDDFNNITTQQTALHSHVTRSVTSSKPLAITATKQQVYFNSFFLPKTSTTRDLKELWLMFTLFVLCLYFSDHLVIGNYNYSKKIFLFPSLGTCRFYFITLLLIHLNLQQRWKTICCQVDWLTDFDINDSWPWHQWLMTLTVGSHGASTLLARLQCILAPSSSINGCNFFFQFLLFFHCFVSVKTICFVIIHCNW